VFLLQNTGYLPSNFWLNLWRLWPLILVLVGIELLLANRVPWLALLGIGAVVLLVGAIATRSSLPPTSGADTVGRSFQTNLDGARQANVIVRFGAGQLRIAPIVDASPDALAAMTYDGPEQLIPQPRYTPANGGTAQLEIQASGHGPGFFPFGGNRSDAMHLDVNLTPSVPIPTLTVQSGAADAQLDLSSLNISNLDLSIGAASAWVRLPQAVSTTSAHISGGAATITIEVPQGVAAQIRHRGGLSTLNVDTNRFPVVGQELYKSPDYDSAQHKVDVDLETGIATIQVN
jgi:hypothetical protein